MEPSAVLVTMLNVTPAGPGPGRLIETVRNWL